MSQPSGGSAIVYLYLTLVKGLGYDVLRRRLVNRVFGSQAREESNSF